MHLIGVAPSLPLKPFVVAATGASPLPGDGGGDASDRVLCLAGQPCLQGKPDLAWHRALIGSSRTGDGISHINRKVQPVNGQASVCLGFSGRSGHNAVAVGLQPVCRRSGITWLTAQR